MKQQSFTLKQQKHQKQLQIRTFFTFSTNTMLETRRRNTYTARQQFIFQTVNGFSRKIKMMTIVVVVVVVVVVAVSLTATATVTVTVRVTVKYEQQSFYIKTAKKHQEHQKHQKQVF